MKGFFVLLFFYYILQNYLSYNKSHYKQTVVNIEKNSNKIWLLLLLLLHYVRGINLINCIKKKNKKKPRFFYQLLHYLQQFLFTLWRITKFK